MATDWTVEAVSSNVHTIRFDDIGAGWTQRVMLSGDRHHDNVYADWKLEKAQLDKAREYHAPIIDLGDMHDAMQGKKDGRQDADQLRPEYIGNDYTDRLVNVATDFYGPYADLFALLAYGNHETAALRHLETDLTARTARELRHTAGGDWPYAGAYGGWIIFRFTIFKTTRQTIRLKYHHGHGGGGPVTRGVIQTNRHAVYLPDADIMATAHIHEAWSLPITRERLTQAGRVWQDYQWHVSVPTYKSEYFKSEGMGYHHEGGRPPKPTGCAWLVFELDGKRVIPRVELDLG
jgi:hypothetical protein